MVVVVEPSELVTVSVVSPAALLPDEPPELPSPPLAPPIPPICIWPPPGGRAWANSAVLTELSPLESSLVKSASACAVVPPAAVTAVSSSDWEIWPSPLVSIFENNCCSRGVNVGVADDEVPDCGELELPCS